jgi:hypothetical protein
MMGKRSLGERVRHLLEVFRANEYDRTDTYEAFEVLEEIFGSFEVDVFRCPRCGADVRRDEIALHPAHEQDPPWNTGFEWVGSCPECDAKRRRS